MEPSSASPSTDQGVIHIQINNVDSYQHAPTPFDRTRNPTTDEQLFSVPIVRVFGSTSTGQNVMVHIHGIYPYFFIEYKGSLTDGK